MNLDQKVATIQRQIDAVVDGEVGSGDLETWIHANEVALRTTLDQTNPTYLKLTQVKFKPTALVGGASQTYYDRARRGGIAQSVSLLRAAIGELELTQPDVQAGLAPGGTSIFIVHGHDEIRKLEVASLVRDLTGTKPIILADYVNRGLTLIEKFEEAANEAAYAIVIASGDDVGGVDSENLQQRARQNVVFEHGFFVGRLGRSRVALLVEENVEIPSDTQGVVYISLDSKGGWKLPLARELNSAGVQVDWNSLAG